MKDEKLALLEHVTYIDKNVLHAAGIKEEIIKLENDASLNASLAIFDHEAINNLRKVGDQNIDGALISGNEWADIIEGIQNDEELSNLVVKGSQKIETSDHRKYNLNIAYEDPKTGQCIISYKGTSGKDEWEDNVNGLVESDTKSQKEALEFFDKYARRYNDLVVTGHSKGANKAMYVTIVSQYSDRISKCACFDGQGFSNEFLEKYDKQIQANGSKITNYFAENDFVNVLMKQVDNSKQVPCEEFGITNPGQFHSPNSIFKRDDSGKTEFSFNPLEEKNQDMELLRDFVSYTMDHAAKKDLKRISDYIGPIAGEALGVEKTDKKNIGKLVVKDPIVFLKIRKMLGDYSKDNNLNRDNFNSLMNQFKVDYKSSQIIDKAKKEIHVVDAVVIKPASYINNCFDKIKQLFGGNSTGKNIEIDIDNNYEASRGKTAMNNRTKIKPQRNVSSATQEEGVVVNKGYLTEPQEKGYKAESSSYEVLKNNLDYKNKIKTPKSLNSTKQVTARIKKNRGKSIG